MATLSRLMRSKTFYLGLSAILAAIAGSPAVAGELTWNQVVAAIIGALYAIFKRDTDAKIERALVNGGNRGKLEGKKAVRRKS